MKTLTVDTLNETEKIKAGETFIYVDGFNVKHKIRARGMKGVTMGEACKKCAFANDACCLVYCTELGRESKYDVSYEELS